MKELDILCLQCHTLDFPMDSYCFDEFSLHLYILTGKTIKQYQFSPQTLIFIKEQSHQLPESIVQSMKYIMEIDSIILIYKDGSMFKIKNDAENVGQFDCGVLAAEWNPNQEQLVVICGDGNMVSFDIQLDPNNEIHLPDLQSTQDAAISFKNDGKFFTINYLIKDGRICQTYNTNFEIFQSLSKSDQEGGLVQAIFENPRQLQNTIAWQPNAGYIASIEKQQTIFWEKNGLRHLEFDNPYEGAQSLQWSPDGQILAVQYENHINLHKRSNFKWYLKRRIEGKNMTFLERQDRPTLVVFDGIEILMYWLQDNYIEGFGLSIDYNKAYLTDFKKMVIPPPLSQHTLQIQGQIQLVYVNKYIFIYTIGTVYVYDFNVLLFQIEIDIKLAHKMVFHFDKDLFGSLIFVFHEQGKDRVAEILIDKEYEIVQIWKRDFSKPTQITAVCEENHQVIMHSRFGERFLYSFYKEDPIMEFDLAQMDKSFDIKIAQHGNWFANLKSNNHLILNHQVLSTDCTSFQFYDEFLVFTANTPDLFHLLYVVDLRKQPITIDRKGLNASNVERGSRLVCIAGLDRVIIQVPRGNLEVLAPRLLSLRMAKMLHEKQDYKESYELIRRHKLDMNLLFDFNPLQFLDDCKVIVQVLKESYLQIFIQSLKNEISFELPYSVSQDEFRQTNILINEKTISTTKINLICDYLIKEMDPQTHILTIVTAMLRKEPSQIEEALRMVMQIKANEQEDIIELPPHLNPETNKPFKKQHKGHKSTQVLEFICWLADANKMFEVALGTYDFELVKQVAQFTQKDPKEYLPQLEKYSQIENIIDRQATIQLELKNYDKCITVLSKGNNDQINRSIDIIQQYDRYTTAIECYKDTPHINLIKELLGNYMIQQKQAHQASLAYESAGLFEKALNASIQVMDTKRILTFKPTSEQLLDLAEHLKESGKWKDCGRVYEYLNDLNQAIHYYCKAEEWKKVAKCVRECPINISEQLKLTHSLKVNQMLQQSTLFVTKLDRLKIVQATKQERGILAPTGLQADFDAVSDVSHKSGTSRTSYTMSVTTGVRKKKQKNEKSFLNRNIKEGSPVEEEYLIELLKNIQTQSVTIIQSLKSFQNYLIYFNQPLMAKDLSLKAKEYIKIINVQLKSVGQMQFEETNPNVIELYNMKDNQLEFQQSLDSLIK